MTSRIDVLDQMTTQSAPHTTRRIVTRVVAFAIMTTPTMAWSGIDAGATSYSTSTQIPSVTHLTIGTTYEATLGGQIRDVKEAAGLTWGQFADLFGVSRRSVHLWVGGGNISADHIARFEMIRAKISRLGTLTPIETRAALFALGANGVSPYADLVAEISGPSSSYVARPLGTGEQESNLGNPGTLIGSETIDDIFLNRN